VTTGLRKVNANLNVSSLDWWLLKGCMNCRVNMAPCQYKWNMALPETEKEATILFILLSGKSQQIAGRVSLLIAYLNLGVIRITVEPRGR
jgi:hypothetical protein